MLGFQVVRRRIRAKPLIKQLRQCSEQFKAQHAAGDQNGMTKTSTVAWDTMTQLFEVLRNEQDHGNLAAQYMDVATGYLAADVTFIEQQAMISAGRLDRHHQSYGPISLREALNKIAHFDTASAAYRLDQRGAHYVVLGGKHRTKYWVAEVLIAKLCMNGSKAVRAIT